MKCRNRIIALVLAVLLLSVTAYAEKFTPSVEQKGAPEIVAVNDKSGNEVCAVIVDANGNEVAGVPVGELVITPVADAEKASEEIHQMLDKAYQQITEADTLTALVSNIPEILKEMKWDIPAEALVVRDLFDVTVTGEYQEMLKQEGNTITVRFKMALPTEEQMLVLHNFESDKWEAIYGETVQHHENGDVSVTFNSLSPVAFAVENSAYKAPEAPAESSSNNGLLIGGIVVLAVVVVVVAVVVTKNKKKPAKKQEQKVH